MTTTTTVNATSSRKKLPFRTIPEVRIGRRTGQHLYQFKNLSIFRFMPPHVQYIIYGQSMHKMTKSAAAHPPSYHQSASQKKQRVTVIVPAEIFFSVHVSSTLLASSLL